MTMPPSETPATPLAIVIDDEEDIRQIARLALRVDGWRVEVANNGREGLELVRRERPDLILLDLMMPSMSGAEFCRKLIKDMEMRDVPVLLVSGVSEKSKLVGDFGALPLRVHRFLKKPFDTGDLIKCVREMIPTVPSRPAPEPTKAKVRPSRSAAGSTAPSSRAPTPPSWLKLDRPARPEPPGAPASPAPKSAPADDHMRGYRILVIDDDADICTVLKMRLGMYHEVEVADNGMQGLQRMETFLPDFVITDINMPVMNGLETAEAIRRHPRFFEVPIFFVTGEADTNLPRRIFEIGGNLYLRKPLDPDRLLKCLDYFLRETGLPPGRYLATEDKAAGRGVAAQPALSGSPRLLVADFNIENHRLLKRLLGDQGKPGLIPGGPLEIFWTEDPRSALAHLNRWEPDLILYNPRNPNLDAVAFGQTLRLNQELDKTHVWLIGTRFYDADVRYSQQTFKHEVINLEAAEAVLIEQLGRAVAEARAALRPKRHAWEQLHAEEVDRLRKLQESNARHARERDMLRKRYRSVQEFIDRTLS
jgi:CheY-like chemotaxis protein